MQQIDGVIAAMRAIGDRLDPGDPRRFFNGTYVRTTEAVAAEIEAGGFRDPVWTERWDAVFASMYIEAFEHWDAGEPAPKPWLIAFQATRGPRMPPLRHVLLGMNAHVNYDLPRALIAVITDDEFADREVTARRSEDHRRIDHVLAGRVADEDNELAKVEQPEDRDLIDRLLRPLNRLGTKRFLTEARRKVWANARTLSEARRRGEGALSDRVTELEELSARRVADLTRPGRVLLELARNGFGVELAP